MRIEYEDENWKDTYSEQWGKRVLNFIKALIAYSRVTIVLNDQFNTRSNKLTIASAVTYLSKTKIILH